MLLNVAHNFTNMREVHGVSPRGAGSRGRLCHVGHVCAGRTCACMQLHIQARAHILKNVRDKCLQPCCNANTLACTHTHTAISKAMCCIDTCFGALEQLTVNAWRPSVYTAGEKGVGCLPQGKV